MSYRKVHIDGVTWEYAIHRSGIKFRTSPSVFVTMSQFTGWTHENLERAAWKGYLPPLTPSAMTAYIKNRLIPRGMKPYVKKELK